MIEYYLILHSVHMFMLKLKLVDLTFIGLCIIMYFYSKTN